MKPADAIQAETFRKRVGIERIRAAMDHIQQAQVELNLAMMDLCSVIGCIPERDRLGKLHQKVKSEWYKLDGLLARRSRKGAGKDFLHLDHTPSDEEQDNAHAGGCGRRSWRESFFSSPIVTPTK